MNPNEEHRKSHINIDKAEQTINDNLAQSHPEWVEKDGSCPSCTSYSHELADPTKILDEVLDPATPKKEK